MKKGERERERERERRRRGGGEKGRRHYCAEDGE